MRNILVTSAAALLLVVTAAQAEGDRTVKSVEVDADLAAIENPAAAAYWTSIADDLENAIVARITDQIADDGVDLSIDISEVELSNGFQDALGLADTKLVGRVKMTHASDNTRFETFDLSVDVNSAIPYLPAGMDVTIIPAETREFYDAMISAYAEAVVDRLT
ncbi:MAG: hypothetical protein HC844_04595 [Tabrizicola sp.]|nr:hypothetical protein [Tabrizicola sp.]